MSVGAIRLPTAAGTFYPEDRTALARMVDRLLVESEPWSDVRPWGIVVPHAGYRYSGLVASSAYAALRACRPAIARVVVIGPAHFVPLLGCAVPASNTWRTPLGDVSIDTDLREIALEAGSALDDDPHLPEHSLEVQLPFLQRLLGEGLRFLPVAVGQTVADDVVALLSALSPHIDLVVVSTDLSHYEDITTARLLDHRTAAAVQALDADAIGPSDACGVFALRGAVVFARATRMTIRLLDLRTSGDTAGDLDRVVGYGAFSIER